MTDSGNWRKGIRGTITRSPIAPDGKLIKYDGFTPSNYLEQPYDPNMDFGEGEAYQVMWHSPKQNWFQRKWNKFKWWKQLRKQSWYNMTMRGRYVESKGKFPDTVIITSDLKNGIQIYYAETMELWF